MQARGLARNAGSHLGSPGSSAETQEADELRTACWEAMCRTDSRRMVFSEALPEIQSEGGLGRCCLAPADHWTWNPVFLCALHMIHTRLVSMRGDL